MSGFRFARPSRPGLVVSVLGFGAVAVIALIGLLAARATFSQQAEIADMQALIAREAASSRTGATTGGLTDDAFFTSETPQLAQAMMQTDLQNLADTLGISVEVIRTDQIEQIDGFIRLNLTISGTAPETELGAFLHGIAALEPIVLVDEVTLRPARVTRTSTVRRVSYQLQLYGLSKR